MAVQVLALSLVAAQLMRAGKVALDHDFKLSGHVCRGKACPRPSLNGQGQTLPLQLKPSQHELQTPGRDRQSPKLSDTVADSSEKSGHTSSCADVGRAPPVRRDRWCCESDAQAPASVK